ncbi:MAG: hypothetical protein RMK29_02830 [Myxococcales bacterium]|nr:hypothetical protein [Myxococcota bacterium]MDW8280617.1 hypothetical protein [Myxococcales bacterium]
MFESYVILVLELMMGVQAIRPGSAPIPPRRAALYAQAAAYHGLRRGIDPFELLGLARNESDFNDRTVGPDGLDCGVTQVRVTYSRYSCEQLQRSAWLAFQEAARELQAHGKSCRNHPDYDRCRLNRYNSGVRYAQRGFHGRYYLRIACFAEAARRRLPFHKHCRRIRSAEELARWIREASSTSRQAQLAPPALAASRPARGRGTALFVSAPWQPLPAWADADRNREPMSDRALPPAWRGRRRALEGRRASQGLRHHAQGPLHLLSRSTQRLALRAGPRKARRPRCGHDAADGSHHAGPGP